MLDKIIGFIQGTRQEVTLPLKKEEKMDGLVNIPVLFKRDQNNLVIPELTEGCEWAMVNPTALITIKLDGIAVKSHWNFQQSRYSLSKLVDGKWVETTIISDPIIWEAWKNNTFKQDAVFEVFGDQVNGNPHNINYTGMVKTQPIIYDLIVKNPVILRSASMDVQTFYSQIKKELEESPEIEGLVFHLEGLQMRLEKAAKIRKKDFGIPWPAPKPDSNVIITV